MGKNNPACKYTFKEGNEEVQIKTCEEERDLGVVFDGKLSFDTHIQSCIKKLILFWELLEDPLHIWIRIRFYVYISPWLDPIWNMQM
jgi:hypothetical protein